MHLHTLMSLFAVGGLVSVTRSGENSPLWQNISSLWQFFDGLISIWQYCEPTLVPVLCCWAIIRFCKGTKMERIILPSGHTVGVCLAATFLLHLSTCQSQHLLAFSQFVFLSIFLSYLPIIFFSKCLSRLLVAKAAAKATFFIANDATFKINFEALIESLR